MARGSFFTRRRPKAVDVPEVFEGIRFPNAPAANRYRELLLLVRARTIRDLVPSTKRGDGVLIFTGTFRWFCLTSQKDVVERIGGGNKFNAKRVEIDDIVFDSSKEGRRYRQLKALLDRGFIRELERQVKFPIVVNGITCARYVADFTYIETATGARVTEDVKGMRTPVYRLKKRLVEAGHGITITEI